MRMHRSLAAIFLVSVVGFAGCGRTNDPPPSASTTATTTERSYPGLFPEYQQTFRPNHSDLGGRSNTELATLLPAADDFPDPAATRDVNIASEDGSGLGLHGQTDGEARPPDCLYSPIDKSYSRAPDGSDWNLYYAASQLNNGTSSDTRIVATVYRERQGADVFALTEDWISRCGEYDRAFPSFAQPSQRNWHVSETFGNGPVIDGVQTYVATSARSHLVDDTAHLPEYRYDPSTRKMLARVHSVVFAIEGTADVAPDQLDRLLAVAIRNANNAA